MVAGRLTAAERANRQLTELDFQRQLVGTKPPGLAVVFGWEHVHFRPAQTKAGWRTPATGSMALGWPDLVLLRVRDRRLIFAELKRETASDPAGDQARVLELLRAIAGETNGQAYPHGGYPGPPRMEVHVWRPSDLEEIAKVLR
jgi:hypothetical protein